METETVPTDHVEPIEQHDEQEERDFIASMGDEGTEFEPQPTVNNTVSKMEIEAAAGMVFVGLMTLEQFMKTTAHPDFSFDPEQAENVATKVAPLIVKYGGNPPPWLAAYMDEIMAVVASVCWVSVVGCRLNG